MSTTHRTIKLRVITAYLWGLTTGLAIMLITLFLIARHNNWFH